MLFGCGPHLNTEPYVSEEERISMLQGVWVDEFSEDPVFRIAGDTLFYIGESFSQFPFYLRDDSLFICGIDTNVYHIGLLEDNMMELMQQDGMNLNLHKSDSVMMSALMLHDMEVPQVTDVIRKMPYSSIMVIDIEGIAI